MCNHPFVEVGRPAQQFEQALLQGADGRQEGPDPSGDLDDGQAHAAKGAQEASQGLTGLGQGLADSKFHQGQHPQGQAQPPNQPGAPSIAVQIQRGQRQRPAFEAPELTLDDLLAAIGVDGHRQRHRRRVGGIDAPAEPAIRAARVAEDPILLSPMSVFPPTPTVYCTR